MITYENKHSLSIIHLLLSAFFQLLSCGLDGMVSTVALPSQ